MPRQSTKETLSRERILETARALVQAEGFDALSMRRLAQELDVWPMSLYHYFRDKDELSDAVAGLTAADVGSTRAEGSPRERLVARLRDAHDAIARDPDGVGTRMARASLSEGFLQLAEACMTALTELGLDERDAARAWHLLWSYTYGSALMGPSDDRQAARRRTRSAIAALDDDAFPTLLAASQEYADAQTDAGAFDEAVELILDALLAAKLSQ